MSNYYLETDDVNERFRLVRRVDATAASDEDDYDEVVCDIYDRGEAGLLYAPIVKALRDYEASKAR